MQDIEFTVQDGKLWMLQTRNGKRTAKAALKIAVDLKREGLHHGERSDDARRSLIRSTSCCIRRSIPKAKRDLILSGLPASPGAASGEVVFSADEAERLAQEGRKVILVRVETSPEDIHGMHAAVGIVTARGGMTSHAAVVARGMGRPCVCGAGDLKIDRGRRDILRRRTQSEEGRAGHDRRRRGRRLRRRSGDDRARAFRRFR